MIIQTVNGAKFNTNFPAKSSVITVLNNAGNKIPDTLKLTGKTEEVVEFMRPVTMIEVEHSFGTDFVNEEFIWQ